MFNIDWGYLLYFVVGMTNLFFAYLLLMSSLQLACSCLVISDSAWALGVQ